MRKFFFCIAALASIGATAQVTVIEEQPNTHVAGFATNRFWDNWEIQGGAGMSFMMGTGSKIGDSWQGVGYLGIGKWIHPVFGMRLTGEGGKIDYLTRDNKSVNSSYIFAHPDFMINMSNWIGGYRDDRVYTAVLTMGAGVAGTSLDHKATRQFEFAASVGMQNRFNVSRALSIDLTVNYALAKASLFPQQTIKSPRFNALSAYVGVTYKFNKRTFNRCAADDAEVAAMVALIAEAEAKVAEVKAENQKLMRLNAEQSRELEQATVKITEYVTTIEKDEKEIAQEHRPQAADAQQAIATDNYDEILFYLYGYGVLSADNKARLDLLADHIKQSDSDKVYHIEGFADPQTGTEKNNIRLAAKRARLAYDYLVSKGVDPARLKWVNGGTKNLPFKHKEQNRVVVIF